MYSFFDDSLFFLKKKNKKKEIYLVSISWLRLPQVQGCRVWAQALVLVLRALPLRVRREPPRSVLQGQGCAPGRREDGTNRACKRP